MHVVYHVVYYQPEHETVDECFKKFKPCYKYLQVHNQHWSKILNIMWVLAVSKTIYI